MEGEEGRMAEPMLCELAAALREVLEWKWDGRFGTVVAEFPLDKKASVFGVLDRYLTSRWDSASIEDAPEIVKKIQEHLGGLMAGQLLLLSDPDAKLLVYCAWWPWGNGQTISIRVGLFGETSGDEGQAPVERTLRAAFDVS